MYKCLATDRRRRPLGCSPMAERGSQVEKYQRNDTRKIRSCANDVRNTVNPRHCPIYISLVLIKFLLNKNPFRSSYFSHN